MDNEDLTMSNPTNLEQDLLRRCLVKVSFAAAGIHKNLDEELQKLRQIIRADENEEAIHQQVEAIAQALMLVDDEIQKQVSLTSDDLLQSLSQQLILDFPEFSKKITGVVSNNNKQPFIATFSRLIQSLPALGKTKAPGFFARLFSRSKTPPPSGFIQDDLLPRVSSTLNQMISQLTALNASSKSVSKIQSDIDNISELDEVPHLIQSVFSEIFDITATEQSRFENFLKNLNTKLDTVQQIISNNNNIQKANNSAGELLDQQVRSQVKTLQETSKSAQNIEELKHVVEDRVEEMMTNLDTYKIELTSFVEKNSQQMEQLSSELDSSRSDIDKLQHQLEEQQHLAETDQLTGLPNRYSFQRHVDGEYSRWRRYRQPLTVAIADIDHFKKINDSHGHSFGDKALMNMARLLGTSLRETDYVARYGGEEFIFIMPETSLTQATKAVNKLRQQISSNSFEIEGETLSLTVSIGVAEFEDTDTVEDVIERADKALYRAKEKGRNQVCCELKSTS